MFRIFSAKGDVDASKALIDQTEAFYERATSGILHRSMLLHFAFADFEEQLNKYTKVHEIYNKFLEVSKPQVSEDDPDPDKGVDPTLCYVQYMKFCRRAEGSASARKVFKKVGRVTMDCIIIRFHMLLITIHQCNIRS